MRLHEIDITEGVYDQHIFKAIFMAGSPGAGKSTVAEKLFKGKGAISGLKLLDVDDFLKFLEKKGKTTGDNDQDYVPASHMFRKRRNNYLEGRLGLVIDSTGHSVAFQAQMKKELENLGYEVAMIFVNTSLETSIERAEKRSKTPGKNFGRKVDREYLKQVWMKTQENLGRYQSVFGPKFFVVNNDVNPEIDYVEKFMRNWLAQPPKSHIAKKWIEANKKGA